eukprot:SAG11_NODE_5109_length_1662_cov_1.055662_2_plen_176_part_00
MTLTTVGYGDIHPATPSERAFSLVETLCPLPVCAVFTCCAKCDSIHFTCNSVSAKSRAYYLTSNSLVTAFFFVPTHRHCFRFLQVAMLIGGFMFGVMHAMFKHSRQGHYDHACFWAGVIVGNISEVIRTNNPGDSVRSELMGKVHACALSLSLLSQSAHVTISQECSVLVSVRHD